MMDRLRANPWIVLLVLCTGFFMILLDTTIVNVAIPSIIDAFNASLDQILWVLNAYVLVYAVLLITAGRLGDKYGQRNLFALGMVIFVVASAFCGFAQNPEQLIAARVVQGLGGAILTPQTMSIITSIFPPAKRGAAFGLWGAVAGIAAVIGPTLGGLIVTNWSWRWIFYVNLPIGVLALVATFLIIPDLRPGRIHRLDVGGVALASLGLFGVVFGLIEGERFDWGTVWAWVTIPEIIGAGLVILIAFVLWERVQKEPLMPFSLFGDRNFSLMNLVGAGVGFGILGMMLPLMIYFQSVMGWSALRAGLTVAPMALTSMIFAPLSGRLADRIGGKFILMFGLVCYAAGMGLAGWQTAPDATWWTFLPAMVLAGLGQGCVFPPMVSTGMRHIEPKMAGAASGVTNTTRQLGSVLGSAVVGAVLQTQLSSSLHHQAEIYATQLPPQAQNAFIEAVGSAVRRGMEMGPAQSGAAGLPAGLPPQAVEQFTRLFHEVFVHGFIDAIRPTMAVPIVVLLIGAIACLGAENLRKAADRAEARTGFAGEPQSLRDRAAGS